MDAYSLLKAAACPTTEHHHEVERTIFGEIVYVRRDRTVCVPAHGDRVRDETVLRIELSRRHGLVPHLQGAKVSGEQSRQTNEQDDCGWQEVPSDLEEDPPTLSHILK